MVKTKIIVVRVTPNQFDRIVNNAHAKGFRTIADYIRNLTLQNDLIFEKKINEIYLKVSAL
jgi:hypothetical protein